MSDKFEYIGRLKEIDGKYGPFLSGDICCKKIPKEFINDRGYLKLTISRLKEVDDRGNTHSVKCHEPYKKNEPQAGELFTGEEPF